MSSPFPGMDPYLEGEMWQEFHETLANQIRTQLIQQLSPDYVALLAKRYVISSTGIGLFGTKQDRVIYPDVHVVQTPKLSEAALAYTDPVTKIEPVEIVSPIWEEIPILSVEIRDVAERRLVTLIEILSPANKIGQGAREYAERRLEIMGTQTHLLEIDLLRRGERIELMAEPPAAAYYVYLSRVQRRPRTKVWPIPLPAPLPIVPVPLLPPDPDVKLDLQAAVDACFNLVGYERLLDYSVPPPPSELSAEDAKWLAEQRQAVGLNGEPGLEE